MPVIDTLKFRNILVNGKIAEEAPADELVEALDETFEDVTGDLATKSDLIAFKAEILQAMAEMEARLQRQMLFAVGIMVAAGRSCSYVAGSLWLTALDFGPELLARRFRWFAGIGLRGWRVLGRSWAFRCRGG